MHPVINRIQQLASQAVRERPALRSEIIESMQLSISEIEDGGSPEHELELFAAQINELKGEK